MAGVGFCQVSELDPPLDEQRPAATVKSNHLVEGAVNGRFQGVGAQQGPNNVELVVVYLDQSLRYDKQDISMGDTG